MHIVIYLKYHFLKQWFFFVGLSSFGEKQLLASPCSDQDTKEKSVTSHTPWQDPAAHHSLGTTEFKQQGEKTKNWLKKADLNGRTRVDKTPAHQLNTNPDCSLKLSFTDFLLKRFIQHFSFHFKTIITLINHSCSCKPVKPCRMYKPPFSFQQPQSTPIP